MTVHAVTMPASPASSASSGNDVASRRTAGEPMDPSSELLKELRIDRTAREAPQRERRSPLLYIAAVVLVLLALASWLLVSGRAAPVVATATVRAPATSTAGSVLDASGYVAARRQATVSAKITGKVAEVLIEEGMQVDDGQVLARLDATDAEAQRALARAQLQAARSQLGEIEANLALSTRELERAQELRSRGLAPEAALDTARAQRQALAARLASAREQVDVSGRQVEMAEIAVDNTIIRAPFAGVVIAKAAQPGEMISPISAGGGFTRTGIGTIVDMDSLEIEVDVGEAYIGRVQPGMPVEATLNAYPDWKIPAEVIAIVPTADRGKATVRVRIAILERDPRIVPNMGVRVSFLERASETAASEPAPGVLVPAAAVTAREGGAVAFVVQGLEEGRGTVSARALTLGRSLGSQREVTAGLAAGDTVVLDPPEGLADGAEVRVATD